MHPDVAAKVEELQRLVGVEGLMSILSDGTSAYMERLDRMQVLLYDPESTLARRITEIAKEDDPEAAFSFQKTPTGMKVVAHGKFSEETCRRISEEFDRICEGAPGMRAMLPDVNALITFKPDSEQQTAD